MAAPLLDVDQISKYFGTVIALNDVSMSVNAGEVMCLLGDNGAGKSTLIKTLSGVHRPDKGALRMNGEEVDFTSPRDALDAGIATVFQDLATIPLMAISRNFFLGREPLKWRGPFRRVDFAEANRVAHDALAEIGIDVRDTSQPVGTLSGGERQSLAIARAVHFGAKVLILDEPTSALGVKQASGVLRYIIQSRQRGLGVIFITHNVNHAYPVGDRFTVLKRGTSLGTFTKNEITKGELENMMAGGKEMDQVAQELERMIAEAQATGRRAGNGARAATQEPRPS